MSAKENFRKKRKFYFSIILFAALMLAIVLNLNRVIDLLSWIWQVFAPLVLGGCIAFVINVLMTWFREKVFSDKRMKNPAVAETLSMICSLLVVFTIVAAVLWIAIPQLISSFRLLADSLPLFYSRTRKYLEGLTNSYPTLREYVDKVSDSSSGLTQNLMNYLRNILPQTLTQTYEAATTTLGAAATFLIGLMFSFYLLAYKGKLQRQMRQLCYTYLPEKKANRLLYIAHLTHDNFNAFIFGQCMEALILATMYTICALIFRLPYTPMIATVFAVFSLIPLFGAFIAWGIGVFLILTVNPWQALTFTIIFIVISQIEGNFIYPRIVGSSIGLPGIWVLAAVTVGGNMLGIIGMIISVPIVALIYTLLSEDTQKRLRNHPNKVEEILHKPNWNLYNPETDTFEDEPVQLDNILEENQKDRDEKREMELK